MAGGGEVSSRNSSSPMRNRLMSPLEGWRRRRGGGFHPRQWWKLAHPPPSFSSSSFSFTKLGTRPLNYFESSCSQRGFPYLHLGLVLRRAWPNYPPTADAIPPPSALEVFPIGITIGRGLGVEKPGTEIRDCRWTKFRIRNKIRGARTQGFWAGNAKAWSGEY